MQDPNVLMTFNDGRKTADKIFSFSPALLRIKDHKELKDGFGGFRKYNQGEDSVEEAINQWFTNQGRRSRIGSEQYVKLFTSLLWFISEYTY